MRIICMAVIMEKVNGICSIYNHREVGSGGPLGYCEKLKAEVACYGIINKASCAAMGRFPDFVPPTLERIKSIQV
jgi:hypothetical protein